MSAATSIVPFQPAAGLPVRESLARAHDYIEKMTKRHEGLRKTSEAIVSGVREHGNTLLQAGCTGAAAAALGAVNGRFGGEEGIVEKWGVSLDQAVAVGGHLLGFGVTYFAESNDTSMELLSEVAHTLGDAGIASGVYRYFHRRGAEAAQRAAGASGPSVAAAANGAKGGALYTVPHPGK
jgi:hypothetical protein